MTILTTLPTFWFAAPSPFPGAENTNPGAQQFDSLFAPSATTPWPVPTGQSSVVGVTIQYIQTATTQELQTIFAYIAQHGLKLALGAGAVPLGANGQGAGTEGYINPPELAGAVRRIASLGGRVDIFDMDEPLGVLAGSSSPGSVTALAQQVATTVALVRAVFPNAVIGESETLANTANLAAWAAAFKQATGTPLAYINADVNFADSKVLTELPAFAAAVRSAGVSFGLLVDGVASDTSSAAWTQDAVKLLAAAAANPAIAPDQYVTVSWDAYPNLLLPAGLTGTLAHVALEAASVVPLYRSGLLSGNPGGTVALAGPSADLLPAGLNGVIGAQVALPGLSLGVAGGTNAAAQFAVVLSDVAGTLSAAASDGGTVSGAETGTLTLTGTLASIDAELAGVTYRGATPGTDQINVTVFGGQGLVGNLDIAVTTAAAIAGTSAQAAGQAQSTVTTLLQQLGMAKPPVATVATWTAALLSGTSLAGIRASVVASAPVTAELTQIAQAASGTSPSAATLAGLANLLVHGQTMADIAASLLPGSPAQMQMQALYAQEIGAAPTAATLGQLTLAFVTGTPVAAIRAQVAGMTAPTTALATMYNDVYGVAATPTQLAAMQARMAATGGSLAAVEAQLDTVARAEVTAMYAQTLDRAPTAQQLTVDAQRLEAGWSMQRIRSINVQSVEMQTDLANAFQTGVGVPASAAALSKMAGMVSGGWTLDQVGGAVSMIANLFQQVTGTPATADYVTSFLTQYASGSTMSQIRAMMVGMPSVYSTVLAAYVKDFGHGPNVTPMPTILSALNNESMQALLASMSREAAADVPSFTGFAPSQTVAANGTVMPFRGLVLADPEAATGQRVFATVKLSNASVNFVSPWGGTISAGGSTFTTGTMSLSEVQAFLQALVLKAAPAAANTLDKVTVTLNNLASHQSSATANLVVQAAKPMAQNVIVDPNGNDTLAASSASDLFVISSPSFGQDTLTGFDVAHDMISLPSLAFASFAAVQHAMATTAAGTVITFDAHDALTLAGVAAAGLGAKTFQFT